MSLATPSDPPDMFRLLVTGERLGVCSPSEFAVDCLVSHLEPACQVGIKHYPALPCQTQPASQTPALASRPSQTQPISLVAKLLTL